MTLAPAPDVATDVESEVAAVATFIDRLVRMEDFPSFVHHVREITSMASKTESSTALLSRALRQDASLSARVIRMANSPAYNHTGQPIADLRFAIMLVGFDKVRDLAVGASVFNHMQRRSPGLRELLVASLLSANHALDLAHAAGYPRAEEAFLCGMFRNLGEIIAACYAPADYERLLTIRRGPLPEHADAERAIFGFTLPALGIAVARKWGLPPAVLATMTPPPPPACPPTGFAPRLDDRELLHRITHTAHALTTAIYRGLADDEVAAYRHALDAAGPLQVPEERLRACVTEAFEEASETMRAVGVQVDHLRLTAQRETATAVIEALADGRDPRAEGEVLAAAPPPAFPDQVQDSLSALRALNAEGAESLAAIVAAALGGCIAASFARAAFMLVTPDRKQMRCRIVVPDVAGGLTDRLIFRLDSRGGPLSAALLAREDLFAGRVADSSWSGERVLRQLGVERFVLLPIAVGDTLIGALFADGPVDPPAAPESNVAACHIRDELVAFFRRQGA
ncbi:MAG: HDOD domain-containing protein [Gemmatimonadales bacterium]|nr:HDOD domain-containing protein [Gemmatimonadales bacterium]